MGEKFFEFFSQVLFQILTESEILQKQKVFALYHIISQVTFSSKIFWVWEKNSLNFFPGTFLRFHLKAKIINILACFKCKVFVCQNHFFKQRKDSTNFLQYWFNFLSALKLSMEQKIVMANINLKYPQVSDNIDKFSAGWWE